MLKNQAKFVIARSETTKQPSVKTYSVEMKLCNKIKKDYISFGFGYFTGLLRRKAPRQ